MESRVEIDKEHFRAVFKGIFERFKDEDEAVVYQALRENGFDATKSTVALESRPAGAADPTQGKTCGSARPKNRFSTDTENEEGIKAGEDVPITGDNEDGDDEDELSGFVPTSNGKNRATRIVKQLGELTVAAGKDFDAGLSNSTSGRSLRSKRKAEGYAEPKIPEKKRGSNSVGLTTPRPRPRTGALVYESHPDELAENDQLQIINEDFERSPDDDDDDDDAMLVDVEDKNSIPCRTLDDYTLFDELNGQQIVSWEVIGEKGRNVIAVGKVKAIMADGEREEEILQEEDESDSEDELAMDSENGKGKGKAVAKSQQEKRSQMDQIVRLSAVFYWQDEVTKDGTVIWLRTQFAWYKLLSPSLKMAPLVMPVIRQLNLSTLVINTLVLNPSLEWEQFIKSLESSASGSTSALAAFCYTEKEVKTHAKQINEEINSWIESYLELGRDFPDGIFDSPIVRKIQLLSDGVRIAIGNAEGRRTIRRNVNDEVLKHKNDTTVTPWINKIAAGLFVRTLIVAEGGKKSKGIGDAQETEKDAALLVDLTCDPKTARNEAWNGRKVTKNVKWLGGSIWEDELSGRTGYAGVEIDGETLVAGDCVAVRPGLDKHERKDKNKRKQTAGSESENDQDYIEEIWFAKIVFLFEDEDGGKCAHMRWFTHGADTILQETAGPRELFLLNQCDDNLLESVSCNIKVKKLDPEEREPEGEKKKNVFFYRYWYNTEQAYFEDPSKHENNFTSHNSCAKHQECDSCEAISRAKDLEKVSWLQDGTEGEGFSIGGVEYRPGDFVYTIPPKPHDPYFIGQIMKVVRLEASERSEKSRKGKPEGAKQNSPDEAIGVKVRMLKRYDELNTKDFKEQLRDGKMITKDNRHLYFTRTKASIPAKELAGKCWVLHRETISDLDAFKDQEDTFWFDSYMESKKDETVDHLRKLSKDEVAMPDETINKKGEEESVWKDYKDCSSKLRGMDIFAGAGGLTIGMDKTGAVQTKWAIEFAASAALAFKHNMPDVMVYNQCANLLLDRAIREHEGETIKDLKDFQGKLTPDMPKKGEVDFIYGGPPCQGFSGINRFQKVNDIKNSLIATFLSYVDFYQPQYFLLENVKGLLSHKLGQIKMGTVKFILRALTSMGYQARFGLLQAGQQGVPQTRRRVIFWGAKLGVDLPLFPQPSHCFSKNGQCTINLPDDMGSFATSKRGNHAPHASVLVGDVIVDLPGFEYENPHIVYPATAEQKQLESKRPWKKYDINVCNKLGFAGKEKQSYKYPPLTEFQRSVRRGVQNDELTCHFTRTFNLTNVERICRIDLKPGSDHHTLPDKLKPWCLSHPDSKAAAHNGWRGLYGRLDPDGIFGTALTEIQPCGKSGTVIHPTQHRVISVREHARCQGFPDWYLFLSDTNKTAELHRQIGNAVPIPLAGALGKGLRDVVVEKWRKQRAHLLEGGDNDDEL